MLISLSLWTFILLVADPTFPHTRKSLISVQISSKSRSGSSWFCWPRKSNPCRNRCFPSHLSPQGCTSRFCHCHFVGWTHMCRVNRGNIGGGGSFTGHLAKLLHPDMLVTCQQVSAAGGCGLSLPSAQRCCLSFSSFLVACRLDLFAYK